MINNRDTEINKTILEWFIQKNYQSTASAFMKEASLCESDASKGNELDKKWGIILSLQKKITELETQIKQIKEDLENGTNAKNKTNELILNLPKSIPKSILKGHKQSITCLSFHPFYKRLASASEDASIIIWECDEFTQDKYIRAHSNTVNHITFDNKGKFLGSCSSDLSIKIWNFENLTCFKTLNGHEHSVSFIEFSPDSNFIFSASRDKSIKYWEVNTGICKKNIMGHNEWVRCVSVNFKGNLLSSCSDDNNIIIWEVDKDFNQFKNLNGHSDKVEYIIFLKNDKSIINVFSSDYARNLNNNNNEEKNKSDFEKINEKFLEKKKLMNEINKMNKEYLLSASRDKLIMLWDVFEGICIKTFNGHINWVRSLCEHPSGNFFISCSDDKSIRIWDLKSGECKKKLEEVHDSFIVTIAMSPKCKLLASGSNDLTIKVWDCS